MSRCHTRPLWKPTKSHKNANTKKPYGAHRTAEKHYLYRTDSRPGTNSMGRTGEKDTCSALYPFLTISLQESHHKWIKSRSGSAVFRIPVRRRSARTLICRNKEKLKFNCAFVFHGHQTEGRRRVDAIFRHVDREGTDNLN